MENDVGCKSIMSKWFTRYIIKYLDDITKFIIETVSSVLQKNNDDFEGKGDEMVKEIKKTMDQKWGEYWHIIMGKSFGSFCTHESRLFIFFYYGELAVMAFKSG